MSFSYSFCFLSGMKGKVLNVPCASFLTLSVLQQWYTYDSNNKNIKPLIQLFQPRKSIFATHARRQENDLILLRNKIFYPNSIL